MVYLEPFSEPDFDRLIAWIPTAEFLLQWAGPLFTFPLNRPQLEKYLETCRESPPARLAFCGVNTENGGVVGHVELGEIDLRNRSARLARVLVGPGNIRGKGFGRQLVQSALIVAFEELRLHRVDLFVFDFNKPAILCYEGLGFQHEGVMREARKHGDTYWNVCVMSLLERERLA